MDYQISCWIISFRCVSVLALAQIKQILELFQPVVSYTCLLLAWQSEFKEIIEPVDTVQVTDTTDIDKKYFIC